MEIGAKIGNTLSDLPDSWQIGQKKLKPN